MWKGRAVSAGILLELKAVNGFVLTVMYKGGGWVHFTPGGGFLNLSELGGDTVCHFDGLLILGQHLFGFVDALIGPQACCDIVGCGTFSFFEKILDDGGVLHGGSTLEKEDLEVLGNAEEGSKVVLGLLRYGYKFFGAMGHLHD